jgi:hypothetical protein
MHLVLWIFMGTQMSWQAGAELFLEILAALFPHPIMNRRSGLSPGAGFVLSGTREVAL